MPQSKAHIKATNKYISKAYDRVNLTLPKGKKEKVRKHAESKGMSLNAYINALIAADMGEPQTEDTANPDNSED